MFVNPNGAISLRHSHRFEKTGLLMQLKLMSAIQSGYCCIRILAQGTVLLPNGGISE